MVLTMSKVYLVGGAVRDYLMGIYPKDFDFVVTQSSPEEMLELGFKQVGADFPVFLHPVTGDEYALARTERKTGSGYGGFSCEWKDVTLADDLLRRDLTLNAMAVFCGDLRAASGGSHRWEQYFRINGKEWFIKNLIDPHNGQQHIKDKTLHHVSEAFEEDPLRVIRIARFLARFGKDWDVAPVTQMLCWDMFDNGELDQLTPERVWKEMSRALMEPYPHLFFQFIHDLGHEIDGGKHFFPEISILFKCPQRPDFHPEGDAGVHTLLCLEAAAKMNLTLEERFAVLCHDFGKYQAHVENSAIGKGHLGGHEWMGVPLIRQFCERWTVTNDCRDLAVLVARYHTNIHNLAKMRPNKVGKMFQTFNLIGKSERGLQIINCCTADGRGRGPDYENMHHPSTEIMASYIAAWLDKVNVENLQHQSKKPLEGEKLGEAIFRERVRRIAEVKSNIKDAQPMHK